MSAASDFYLLRANESARDAQATDLPNVRERCLRAEAAWRDMVERLLRSEEQRARQIAEKAEKALAEQVSAQVSPSV